MRFLNTSDLPVTGIDVKVGVHGPSKAEREEDVVINQAQEWHEEVWDPGHDHTEELTFWRGPRQTVSVWVELTYAQGVRWIREDGRLETAERAKQPAWARGLLDVATATVGVALGR